MNGGKWGGKKTSARVTMAKKEQARKREDLSLQKCKTECCECVQDGGTVCCYCDDGPNVYCLSEDFNLTPDKVKKIRDNNG